MTIVIGMLGSCRRGVKVRSFIVLSFRLVLITRLRRHALGLPENTKSDEVVLDKEELKTLNLSEQLNHKATILFLTHSTFHSFYARKNLWEKER